jgi:predicted HAD superfamily phosphohydrolase YqeG
METKKTNKKLIVFDLDETLVHAFKPTDLPKEMTE